MTIAAELEQRERTWANPKGVLGTLTLVDHKVIGRRFIVTAFVFFLLGGIEALLMRIQLGAPGNTFLSAEAYNQIFTMHGSTMMFLFATPIMEAVGVYLVPLMIGSRDFLFPRLNAFSYWMYLLSGIFIYSSFLFGQAPDGGWFAYTPMTGKTYSPGLGLDFWAIGIITLEISTVATALYMAVTIFKARAPGMAMSRMPLFVWAMLVQSFMIMFAMPVLIVACAMLELDRTIGTRFFDVAAGGQPLLWQHLFWIFGHPEVYLILIPALGIVSMIVSAYAQKRIFGYTYMVLALIGIGFASFGLWVHHMFATGLDTLGLSFFTVVSMLIAIPSGVQIFCWIATIWRSRLVVSTAFLFVLGFIIVFILGGVTGVMVASVPFDLQATDSYFVVAHFHYVLTGGMVFPLFGAFYFWFPKVTGRLLHEGLGKLNFWLTLIGFNIAFFPMHITGLLGMPRRVYTYLDSSGWGPLNLLSTIGSFVLAVSVAIFIWNVVNSLRNGEYASDDPWNAGTLEWATTSPPPEYNFGDIPAVRSAYPLWDEPAEDGTRLVQTIPAEQLDLRNDRPETLVTSVMDAEPENRVVLASVSIWPLLAAIAVNILFLGWMMSPWVIALGAALTVATILGWTWPETAQTDEMEVVA